MGELIPVHYDKLAEWAKTMRDATNEIKTRNARIAALEQTERELRAAVKVLGADLRSYIMDQAVGDWTQDISDEVLANPIAAAAVREAGR